MKKAMIIVMTIMLLTTPVCAENITTSTGLSIPVYPDWTQETDESGSIKCTPAYDGGFFLISDYVQDEPISDNRRDYTYFLFEKKDSEESGNTLLNIENGSLLGISSAKEFMFMTYEGVMYSCRKLLFCNNGNFTVISCAYNISKEEQFSNEFDMWIDSFQLIEGE